MDRVSHAESLRPLFCKRKNSGKFIESFFVDIQKGYADIVPAGIKDFGPDNGSDDKYRQIGSLNGNMELYFRTAFQTSCS